MTSLNYVVSKIPPIVPTANCLILGNHDSSPSDSFGDTDLNTNDRQYHRYYNEGGFKQHLGKLG